MSNQQQQIIALAEERADATIIEISKELHVLTCFPHKRLRILELMHIYAQEVARAAVSEFTVTETC